MKKLIFSTALFIGLGLTSIESKATQSKNGNPWRTFKEVVQTYQTASGQFLLLSYDEQSSFLNAAEAMKVRISTHEDDRAKEKLKKIDITVNVFRFIWESQPLPSDLDESIEIPIAQALS